MIPLVAAGLAAAGTGATLLGVAGKKKELAMKKKKQKKEDVSKMSDKRLDQVLDATGEKQDRAQRKAGNLQ